MTLDLLTWKQQSLQIPFVFGDVNEDLRKELARFYLEYEIYKNSTNEVVRIIKWIIKQVDLLVPFVLIDLLSRAEHHSDPSVYGDWQRDHVLHSLNLFALGTLLLYRHDPVSLMLGKDRRREKLKTLALCALLHDVGYLETSTELVRQELLENFRAHVSSLEFLLRCAYGHNATTTVDLADADTVPEFQDISAPAIRFVTQEFPPPPASSSRVHVTAIPGRRVYGEYFDDTPHGDHGISSAVILSLCREIGTSITAQDPQVFRNAQIAHPISMLWSAYSQGVEAIASHDRQADHVHPDRFAVNPWVPFLHVLDELAIYDREPLDPNSPRASLSIRCVRLDDEDSMLAICFPLDTKFNKFKSLNGLAEQFGVTIRKRKINC